MSCVSPEQKTESIETQPLKTFTSESFYQLKEMPKCKFLLDSYCNFLYSPEVLGNLEIKRAQNSTKVLQGETNNGFSQVFYQYSKAKLRNQNRLPKDFYQVLLKYDYFIKLQDFLFRKSRGSMSVSQRLAAEKLDYELGSIWSLSINEAIINLT